MKTTLVLPPQRRLLPHRAANAFTLIELLTVMAIIVVLAGIFLGVAGLVQSKAARSLTQSQIKAIGAGIISYETDNGSAPRDDFSDKLDAVAMANGATNAATLSSEDYTKTSLLLFRSLSGYYKFNADNGKYEPYQTGTGTVAPKTYYVFAPAQFPSGLFDNNGTIIKPDDVKSVLDPYGVPYGYSTLYQKNKETTEAAASTPSPDAGTTQRGYNPTYDLWSTGGYGAGKPYPTDMKGKDVSVFWFTNWGPQ